VKPSVTDQLYSEKARLLRDIDEINGAIASLEGFVPGNSEARLLSLCRAYPEAVEAARTAGLKPTHFNGTGPVYAAILELDRRHEPVSVVRQISDAKGLGEVATERPVPPAGEATVHWY
jgi:hypothetical protein